MVRTHSLKIVWVFAVTTLLWGGLPGTVLAQNNLTLLKKYDLGTNRYSEGLDFYNELLWLTTKDNLYELDLDAATDLDGDGDYDVSMGRTWVLTHNNHSESSVWLNGELFNFAFFDTTNNVTDEIFKLVLNEDETYQWLTAGHGQGATNWGSCRDRNNPGEAIIYTGHYDNLLMWYEPATGQTTHTLEIPNLNAIEDLGMDMNGTVWASSFYSESYPGLFRIDPQTGDITETFPGPEGLHIIDGLAIRTHDNHEVMYVTGKSTRFIWEYLVPQNPSEVPVDGFLASSFKLHPNYPNPFNPRTTFSFSLPSTQQTRLCVFSLDGRLVSKIVDEPREAGTHSVTWNGTDDNGRAVASGTYVYRLEIGDHGQSRQMVLLR